MKEISKVHNIDSRLIDTIIKDKVVDVTITSPPYFDLKDYGSEQQIGFGQKYDEYLNDLKVVFKNVYDVTKDTGTLWVIIDTYRRDGEVVPLPFDFSNKIKEIGWKLQEVIIWKKDKTVPWAHKGQMRSIFEYILVFSKSSEFNFHIDKVRDFTSLKKWWVKYPERYNPKGKTPHALWDFGIPVQGSWGNGYIDHFCPLPEELIEQILKITTNENDLVLDCFSGSGAVLSKADNMNRKYIGFELNPDYIDMFQKYIKKTGEEKRNNFLFEEQNTLDQDKFEKLILELRALKYARLLYKELKKLKLLSGELKIKVEITSQKATKKNARIVVKYDLLLSEKYGETKLNNEIMKLINKQPLSKFGIEPKFSFMNDIESFESKIKQKFIYCYSEKVTHKFLNRINKYEINESHKSIIIFSNIKVDLNESDYE
jgi:DNA modification methylase